MVPTLRQTEPAPTSWLAKRRARMAALDTPARLRELADHWALCAAMTERDWRPGDPPMAVNDAKHQAAHAAMVADRAEAAQRDRIAA